MIESILNRDFVQTMLQAAKHCLTEDHGLRPVLFLRMTDGERTAGYVNVPDSWEAKQLYFAAVGARIRQEGKQVAEALFLGEGWVVEVPKGEKALAVSPSQHPNRNEAITLFGRNVDRSRVIDDLFEMAQLDAGGLPLDRAPVSIPDLISDTIEGFSAVAAARGIALTGGVEPGVDVVRVDAGKIGRALGNLVDNALRYTPAGGSVHVQAMGTPQGVKVEVSDTGDGIPPADLEHVFERFYRGEGSRSRETGGAGLGLAITRGVVEAHGGHIGVESTPGAGTRFYFVLPRKVSG